MRKTHPSNSIVGGFAVMAVLALIMMASPAHAVNHSLKSGELNWNVGTSWDTGLVPDRTTDATVRAYVSGADRIAIVDSTVPEQYLVYATGNGTIKVTNGGVLDAYNYTQIFTGGELRIEGTGVYNAKSRLYVGYWTDGVVSTVTMTGGELNTSQLVMVGQENGNREGLVNISGGTWTIDGAGTLRLAEVGTTSKGTINLSGSGKIVNSRSALQVGYNGAGAFYQTGGEYKATVAGGGLQLGTIAGSSGTYSISGGVLDLKSVASASVTAGAGTARFEVTGAWDVAGVTDEIAIGGNLTLNTAASTLAFNLSAAGIEQIMVGGNADLSNATLEIALADGYDGANLRGTFTTFELLHTGGTITTTGLSLLDNLPSGLRIGDWGVSTTGSQTLWVTVIPEPSSLALLGLVSLVLMKRRKRTQG